MTWQGSKIVRIFYLKNERLIVIDSKKQKSIKISSSMDPVF